MCYNWLFGHSWQWLKDWIYNVTNTQKIPIQSIRSFGCLFYILGTYSVLSLLRTREWVADIFIQTAQKSWTQDSSNSEIVLVIYVYTASCLWQYISSIYISSWIIFWFKSYDISKMSWSYLSIEHYPVIYLLCLIKRTCEHEH